MTLDLGAVSDLRPLLKSRHHLHIMGAHGVQQLLLVFFSTISCLMMMRMVLLRRMEIVCWCWHVVVIPIVSICHHSFLKSCYLKKCFNFCVLSLFSFFNAFKMGRTLTFSESDVTYLRREGAVWPPASRGRHAEMQRLVTDWVKHRSLPAQPLMTPILLLSWGFDVCLFAGRWAADRPAKLPNNPEPGRYVDKPDHRRSCPAPYKYSTSCFVPCYLLLTSKSPFKKLNYTTEQDVWSCLWSGVWICTSKKEALYIILVFLNEKSSFCQPIRMHYSETNMC